MNKTYTVKSGDTLWSIAKRFGISVDELKKINNLTSNSLRVGQTLILSKKEEEPIEENTYVVKQGDTLYSIARIYNINVDELKNINNLTSDTLSIGQVLKLNNDNNTDNNYIEYIVKKGDNLYSIARKFNVSVDSIKRKNNLKTNVLSIGQSLII